MASICSLEGDPLKLDDTSNRIMNVIKKDDDFNWHKKPQALVTVSLSQFQGSIALPY